MKKILIVLFLFFVSAQPASAQVTVGCGNFYDTARADEYSCSCDSGTIDFSYFGRAKTCCGWVLNEDGSERCFDSPDPDEVGPPIEITEGVSNATFNSLNPLKIAGSPNAEQLSTPGGIVSRLLNFLFPLAGLLLFLLISWGGFEILAGAPSAKGNEAGKNRITAAIIGFILLFSTYWMAQIVEVIFGITIL